jgi:hypothetical protein
MVGNKIKYTCKNCGWTTSIREEWADLKPKRCMNKKCNTSFQKFPESLIAERPKAETAEEKKFQKRSRKNETQDSKPE